VSMPDIDIDFPDDRREEVLLYVRKKYGEDRVAQICTFGTMAARASVKDVGRVLGLGFTDMNNFAKLIPERPGITLQEAHEDAADLRKALEEKPPFSRDLEYRYQNRRNGAACFGSCLRRGDLPRSANKAHRPAARAQRRKHHYYAVFRKTD
jgi:hypothetical protein